MNGGDGDDGWERSAAAWIAALGEHGDFARREVLDPVMLPRARAGAPRRVLDVGCGEGRFCRMLRGHGVEATGLDPTAALLARARELDPGGTYVEGRAEALPFEDGRFDRVVSYLSLIDVPDLERAVAEMTRVLRPGGHLLVANLNPFHTATQDVSGLRGKLGAWLGRPVQRYLEPRAQPVRYRGIAIVNHHRPLRAYFEAFLGQGLVLEFFDEPEPRPRAPAAKAARYRRAPWCLVMEWRKPGG